MGVFFRILAIVGACLFGLFAFAVFPEPILLVAYIVFPFLVARSGRRLLTAAAVLISVSLFVLHFRGYKLYGSAVIAKTLPLQNVRRLTGLEPPNELRFADGSVAALSDVYFPSRVDLRYEPDMDWSNGGVFRLQRLLYVLGNRGREFFIDVQMDSSGHAITQRRQNYWCGNTFFPTFLPRQLPSHKIVDLGITLVQAGLAIPSEQAGEDRAYRKELIESLSAPQDSSYYFASAGISRNDASVVALGRSLATADSRWFVTGAYLLIAAQDTDCYPALRKEILRREAVNRQDYNEVAQIRSDEFHTLLVWLDPEEARRELLPISFANGSYGPTWPESIMILACHGDLQGFDAAFEEMLSLFGETRRSAEATLKSCLKWPEHTPFFAEWYQNIRPRLRSGRGWNGELAFWVEGGKPFDAQYFATMPKSVPDVP